MTRRRTSTTTLTPRALLAALFALASLAAPQALAKPKIHVAFQWHMHQPIYWPYESVVDSARAGRYSFNVVATHTDRWGPYTNWPMNAVEMGAAMPHHGAQMSFTGSLIENLNAIERAGQGFGGWKGRLASSPSLVTARGNPRLDLVLISYHHPLLPLIPEADRGLQVALHRRALARAFGEGAARSKGMFPPETAFAPHIIPHLVAEGVQWIFVDNIHFDRARPDYPHTPASNLFPPNPSEQRNTGGAANWVQLQNLWAPSKVSAPWGYQPHWVEYVDPSTGARSRVIAVPAARYEGNEDGRGGYGAFLYERVMSQYEAYNTDDAHPMLVVLHHDGDNFGGGTDSYYGSNFASFVSWIQSQGDRFESTTVQDYLDRFPPAPDDVIHVEPGSWAGADNGDPEFAKWNAKPAADGYSPDRASWAVITAAANRVHTAQALAPATSHDAILDGAGTDTDKAWHFLLASETSCYWYWDFSEGGTWDSHTARGSNQAVNHADRVIAAAGSGTERTPPTIFHPQREPYNPGGREWGAALQPSDFDVWTYVADVSGVADVTLHYRVSEGKVPAAANALYAGAGWKSVPMARSKSTSRANPAPTYIADAYRAKIVGVTNALVDYYVSARDVHGVQARSPIQHVYVGLGTQPGPSTDARGVSWTPTQPTRADALTISAARAGRLHWGVNGWTSPPRSVWPEGTVAVNPKAVETPLLGPDAKGRYAVVLPRLPPEVRVVDFVVRYADDTWDNNGGQDFHVAIADAPGAPAGDGGVAPPGPSSGGEAPAEGGGSGGAGEGGEPSGPCGEGSVPGEGACPRADGPQGVAGGGDGTGSADEPPSEASGEAPPPVVEVQGPGASPSAGSRRFGCAATDTGLASGLAGLLALALGRPRRRARAARP